MFFFDKHMGTFDISIDMIEKYPDNVMNLLQRVIVIRAECMLSNQMIEYTGISDLFDLIHVGEIIPKYKIISKNGKIIANRLDY